MTLSYKKDNNSHKKEEKHDIEIVKMRKKDGEKADEWVEKYLGNKK